MYGEEPHKDNAETRGLYLTLLKEGHFQKRLRFTSWAYGVERDRAIPKDPHISEGSRSIGRS